ncbi:MAG: recombinase family protein [Oscillospiraceae bacterium]
MNIAYVRVSTVEQNEARQVEALEKYTIDKWYMEKMSAKDINRPKLQQMLEFAREGDTIFVHDFTRLARSTKDLLDIVEQLKSKNIHLVSNKENIDTSTPTGKLMLTFLTGIAEFERENLLERQREGIAIAKRNGIYKGRKPICNDKFSRLYADYLSRKISKTALAKMLGVSRPTLYRMIKEFDSQNFG